MKRQPPPYPEFDDTAHCRLPGVDKERFHPPKGVDSYTHATTKKLCTGGGKVPACPFLEPCREYAIHHAVQGVWAGTTDLERREIRKRRRIVPVPLSAVVILPRNPGPPGRVDAFALVECVLCGKEMRPQSIRQHRRDVHEELAS